MSPLIVVVEDETPILEVLRDILELEGYSVLGISDPAHIYCIEPGLQPDLILIDMMLPGMSGIEVARELRTRLPSTPMVAMSASKLMVTLGERSGAFDEAVDKSVDLADLLECVQRYVPRGAHVDV